MTFTAGELTIEPKRNAEAAHIGLFWKGKSNDRHPARTVVPYLTDVLSVAKREKASVVLHFETIEHMNSSTITAIIQIIQQARNESVPLVIAYDEGKNWQKLSFEALSVFVKGDGLLQLQNGRTG